MKIDPHKNKETYLNWKIKVGNTIEGISKENSNLILNYISDMENGLNVAKSHKKCSRSYIRLNTLRHRLCFLAKEFEARFKIKQLSELTEEQLFKFFNDMRNGKIKRKDGAAYQSTADFVKVFKAYWHWFIKVSKKGGKEVIDITTDLDTSAAKPDWVYLNEEQVKKLCDNAKYEYKILIMFLYDTGIRAPTELMNIKVSDFFNEFKELQIREEISKTFGRRIKLLLSSTLIKEYIQNKSLKKDDLIFPINPSVANKYLQRLAQRLFGDAVSEAGQKYSQLTMYDFRHCSCCYWLPRYKSESALKYRFGWKSSDKIHYYSELLGMKDTISEEDLLIDVTKTEMEKRLLHTEKENALLNEKLKVMEKQMEEIYGLTKMLYEKKN
jgi:integrase